MKIVRVTSILRLRGIIIGWHFLTNMKVQTAMCKDSNSSKGRAATYVKFDIYKTILVDYSQCIKCSFFNISVEFQDIKFHQS